MATQNLDFTNLSTGDTGEEDSTSIQPLNNGETATQAVLRRPAENLRSRTEIIRTAVKNLKYTIDADRDTLIFGGGNVVWDGSTTDSHNGKFTIDADLIVKPFLAPKVCSPASYLLGAAPTSVLVSTRTTVAGIGTLNGNLANINPPRAYSGANEVTVKFVGTDGGGLLVTQSGSPADDFTVTYDSNITTGTTCQALITYLMGAHVFTDAGLVATLPGDSTGSNKLGSAGDGAWHFLAGAADAEKHVITAAGLAAFFGVGANVLAEGDVLCIGYDKLVDVGDYGGRRQSMDDAPEASSSVNANLFNLRLSPKQLTHALPVAMVISGDLVFLNGAFVPTGGTGTVQGSYVQKSGDSMSGALTVAPAAGNTVAVTGTGHGSGYGLWGTGGPTAGAYGVLGTGGPGGGVGVLGQAVLANPGVKGLGSSTASSPGVSGVGAGSANVGVQGQGSGTGTGVVGIGGNTATAIGVYGQGSSSGGAGVSGLGVNAYPGVLGTGSATASSPGVSGVGAGASNVGVLGQGAGTGAGVVGTGGSSGEGGNFTGVGGSNGITVQGGGTGGVFTGGTNGKGLQASGGAGTLGNDGLIGNGTNGTSGDHRHSGVLGKGDISRSSNIAGGWGSYGIGGAGAVGGAGGVGSHGEGGNGDTGADGGVGVHGQGGTKGTGGADGVGGAFTGGGSTNGIGTTGAGTGSGSGGSFSGGSTGAGVIGTGGSGGAPGAIFTAGGATNDGVRGTGTGAGYGGKFASGATTGAAVYATTSNGVAIRTNGAAGTGNIASPSDGDRFYDTTLGVWRVYFGDIAEWSHTAHTPTISAGVCTGVRYYLDAGRVVHFTGKATGVSGGEFIVLPAGYFPNHDCYFPDASIQFGSYTHLVMTGSGGFLTFSYPATKVLP